MTTPTPNTTPVTTCSRARVWALFAWSAAALAFAAWAWCWAPRLG